MNAQEIVAANVAARGYRDGWTAEQFVARQLCKLTEELDEAVKHLRREDRTVFSFAWELAVAGPMARRNFDYRGVWDDVSLADLDGLRSELADMQVVILAAAQALDFDVIQAAIDKSSADVARGVR